MAPWGPIFQVVLSRVPASYLGCSRGAGGRVVSSTMWFPLSFHEHTDHPLECPHFQPGGPGGGDRLRAVGGTLAAAPAPGP